MPQAHTLTPDGATGISWGSSIDLLMLRVANRLANHAIPFIYKFKIFTAYSELKDIQISYQGANRFIPFVKIALARALWFIILSRRIVNYLNYEGAQSSGWKTVNPN